MEVRHMTEEKAPKEALFTTERRVKVLRIGVETILTLLAGMGSELPRFVSLPTFPNLPDGCRVDGCCYDPLSRCMIVFLSHPSFEAVPDGVPAPMVDEPLATQWRAYEIERLPVKSEGK